MYESWDGDCRSEQIRGWMLSSRQGNSVTCGFVTDPRKSALSSEKPQTDKGYFLFSLFTGKF